MRKFDGASTIEIRQADTADFVMVRALQVKSWRATYPSPGNGVTKEWVYERTGKWLTEESLAASRENFSSMTTDSKQFYRIAVVGGRVVGMMHISSKDDHTKELEALYIDPDYFGQGLGDRLMKEGDEWTKENDTELQVATYNERAIRFYEKYGFKIVPGTEEKFRDVIPVITMKRVGGKR